MSRKITLNSFLIFEPDKKTITGRGNPAVISASASLCLELLIDNVGQLVTHQQFYDYVWRRFGTEPTSTSLYQNISALRRALNKAGLQEEIIRTMPRKGFLLSPKITIQRERISVLSSVSPEPEREYVLPSGVNDAPGNGTSDEKMNTVQNEPKTDSLIKSIVYAALNEHQISQAFLKPIKVMTAFLVLLVVLLSLYFFYIRDGHSKDAVFIHSIDYKGCTIFNNTDGWLRKDEVMKVVDGIKISCNTAPYIYLTAFKNSDSLSYFNCENPLDGQLKAKCRSHYYVKNLKND